MFDIAAIRSAEEENFRLSRWETIEDEELLRGSWGEPDEGPYYWSVSLRRVIEENGYGDRRVNYRGRATREVTVDGEDWVSAGVSRPTAAAAVAELAERFWNLLPAQYCLSVWEKASESSEAARAVYDEALAEESLCAVNLAQTLTTQTNEEA